jgi:Chromo (CHRromatin Organisation MOdifier) domain
MKELGEQAKQSLLKAQVQMKKQYDCHRQDKRDYNIGDQVWLEATNLKTKRPTKKFDDKRIGPFMILEKVGESADKLKIPPSWQHYPVFNEALLTPYTPQSYPSQTTPRPPPELDTEGVLVYKVEKIIRSRKIGREIHCLVKWKGYPESENTWEPEKHLTQANDTLEAFKKFLG